MRYRKKPVEVEVMRLTEDTLDDIRDWLADNDYGSYPAFDGSGLIIPTLEGEMEAGWGWWIIKGVEGEFYPCRDDIFRQTYEPVEED